MYIIIVDIDPNAPGFEFADEKLCISTNDVDAVLKEAERLQINGILTTSDYPINTVAKVCGELHLRAMTIEVAHICTNKYLQQEFLAKNSIKTPFYKLLKSNSDLESLCDFPMIIKPVDSSASRGVKRINNKEGLMQQYPISAKFSRTGEVIVEAFIEGREFSVETFTQKNVTTVVAITEKVIGDEKSGFFVEDCHIVPANIRSSEEDAIKKTVITALQKLGVNNSPTHTEVKINDEGVFIIEIGCRLGGDYITSDLVPLATGVDMLTNLIKVSLGESIDLNIKESKTAAVQFLNNKNYQKCKEFINHNLSSIISYEIKEFHKRNIENSLDRMGHLILCADHRSEIDALLTRLN